MKVCYFLTDRHGPGNLRCLIPGDELERQYGWETVSMQTLAVVANHLLVEADVYVMARQTHPDLPTIVRSMVGEQGKCVVGEVDDWFLGLPSVQEQHAPRAYYTVQPKILGACSGMTVSTPELAAGYGRIQPNVRVIRNRLDWRMWEDVSVPQSERFRVGWMGGIDWHLRDLAVISGLIERWLLRHPDAMFVAAGDHRTHDVLKIPLSQRITYPTVPFARLPEITATMDVGLVPLADSRFNDAKSYLKGMEYAACGIPCIASPSQEYREWVEHGVNGWLANKNRPVAWLAALDLAYDAWKAGTLDVLGKAARAKAERNTIQEHVHEWHDYYMEVLG